MAKLKYDYCDNNGKKILNISIIYQPSDKIVYEVIIPENNKCIEFWDNGSKNCRLFIEKIDIF